MPALLGPWPAAQAALGVACAVQADASTLRHLQDRRLADLLAAARRSPLYARWLAPHDPSAPARDTWQRLPVARKHDLMAQFEDWVCDPGLRLSELRAFVQDPQHIAVPFQGRYTVWESSGSSGEPALFVQDEGSMAVYEALEGLRRPEWRSPWQVLLDPWGLSERMAFVGATGGHFASIVSIERMKRQNPAWGQHVHSLSFLQPLPDLLAQLQALSPTVLATYPTTALVLAQAQRSGQLRIAPRELWTGGETLTDSARQRLEGTFEGCHVVNSYGASEFLALACECQHGHLHLNSDWALLESVDEHGRPVPCGVTGATTLLTNLVNHVQPIIRFDLGDRVRLHAQLCECGSPLPTLDIHGRHDDSVTLRPPGHRGAGLSISALALSTVLESEAGLFEFQLVQQGPTDLVLRTGASLDPDLLLRAQAALRAFLDRQGADFVRLHEGSDQALQLGRSGKIKRVIGLHPSR